MRRVSLLFALAGAACTSDDSGRLHADWIDVETCRDGKDQRFEPYELEGQFFGVEERAGVAFIRMQRTGRQLGAADALVIELDDVSAVTAGVDHAIDGPLVRATLSMYGSCPDTRQSVVARGGSVRFTHLGLDADERVAATFAFQDLVDLRTGKIVGKNFSGDFDFHVTASPPHQSFADGIH